MGSSRSSACSWWPPPSPSCAFGSPRRKRWSARDIIRRLISGDLTPSVYYSAGLRMVYAALLSLMLSFLLLAALPISPSDKLIYVVAFLTGMLPLDMIEGINGFHAARLSEVGVDNAQNLAEANLLDLLLRTPFNPGQLIDWIAQAKLYAYFKADIEKLRRVGIRTIFDFRSRSGRSARPGWPRPEADGRGRAQGARKTIRPTKDSADDFVSFVSIDTTIASGLPGRLDFLKTRL